MPLPYHLIDGYNLLHAAGLARASYGPGDLDRARTALLVRLADGLDDAERPRTTVVFDAADPPPDADRSFRFREMTVVFSVDEGEADALIEELIRRHPSPRQLRVVSEDLRLQKAAKRRGAQAVKSEAYLDRLRRRTGPAQPRNKGRDETVEPAGGVGDWLDFFGMSGGAVAVTEPSGVPHRHQPPGRDAREESGPGREVRFRSVPSAASARAPAPPKPRVDEDDPEVEDAAAFEELGFWQRRIDELMRDEGRRSEGG